MRIDMRASRQPGAATKLRSLVAIAMSFAMAGPGFGQADGELKLRATQGEGAFNDMKSHTGRGLSVEVRDERGQPVAGATVSFTTPAVGPGGTFANGQRTVTATTDDLGIAASGALRPNTIEGRYSIAVEAHQGNKTGSMMVGQSNTLAGASTKSSKKKWIIIGAIGGGAGAALLLGRRGSSSSPQSTPTVLSTGAVVVGGPR